jgi:deoxyhypusine synthase
LTALTSARRGKLTSSYSSADISLNRIGNLLVPNSNYGKFEDWVMPILDQMVKEQEGPEKVKWTPSTVINRLGKEINNEESVYYWCWKVSSGMSTTSLADDAERHSRLLPCSH